MRMVGPRHFVDDGVAQFPAPWQWGSEFGGQVVVVIGNGPSLSRFQPELLAGVRLIAINSACRWAHSIATKDDFLYFADNSWNERYPDLADRWPGVLLTANRYAAARLRPRARRLDVTALSQAVAGNPDAIHASSGHTAATLACAMCAARVVLLGFDARLVDGRSHWHGDYSMDDAGIYADRFVPGWWGVAEVAEMLGVEIVNATPDSAINGIPFVPLPKALAA